MSRSFYSLGFYGLKRRLPFSYISSRFKIANFNILGDVELCEKAGEELEKMLKKNKIKPRCFVGPEVKVVPFVHHLAKRFGHKRYVILRKSVKGYMSSPLIENPSESLPKHVKKLVLNYSDKEYLIRIKKGIVLIDDVVSTGATMEMLEHLLKKIGVEVAARCAIFKQGERYQEKLIYLSKLPVVETK